MWKIRGSVHLCAKIRTSLCRVRGSVADNKYLCMYVCLDRSVSFHLCEAVREIRREINIFVILLHFLHYRQKRLVLV